MKENIISASPPIQAPIQAIVWDVGNVLIDWDPKYLYRQMLDDEAEIDKFLTDICDYQWNLEQDRGRLWADAVAEKVAAFPQYETLIRAYDERWTDMVSGSIQGSVDILNELHAKKFPLYAITNFSREKWNVAIEAYPFLKLFDGVTVSADVKLLKPNPAIFKNFLDTFKLDPQKLLFIDDRTENVEAARAAGFNAVQFFTPGKFRADLQSYGVL